MIAMTWSKRDKRVLTVGGIALATIMVVGRGLPHLRQWSDQRRDAAAEALRQETLASGEVKLLPVLAETLAARRQHLAVLDTMLIAGTSVAEAGAELSNAVSEYADSCSVRVMSLQVRPDTIEARGFARVAVRLTGVGDVTGLTSLIEDIETGAPLLAVRELGVTQPDPTVASSKPETLRFELLVEALAVIRKPAT